MTNIKDFSTQLLSSSTPNNKFKLFASLTAIGTSCYVLYRLRKYQQNRQAQEQDQNTNNNNSLSSNAPNIPFLNIPLNHQFTSYKGLARHSIGGYTLGFLMGLSLTALCKLLVSNIKLLHLANKSNSNSNIKLSSVISSMKQLFSISASTNVYLPLYLYTFAVSVFFSLEYIWSAIFHPYELSFSSFLLFTHSPELHLAMAAGLVEYIVELIVCPKKFKTFSRFHLLGLSLVLMGQIFRTVAQFTAGISFTHLVAYEKRDEHVLITHGIYSVFRHPSYFGFFYWSVGTQLLLGNPICAVAYSVASWKFFKRRIPIEEIYLVEFFGRAYEEYRARTIIGIPFL